MPTIPVKKTAVKDTANMLNLMREEVPEIKAKTAEVQAGNTETLRAMGGVILGDKNLRNSFLQWLVNRIAMVIVTSKLYQNPWSLFKRGILDYGETIEEIFVELCDPHRYDPATAEREVEKREIPDVRAVFHMLNYEYFYKQTIQYKQLHQAFLSFQGVSDLVSRIITAMYTSANYDEFQVCKYMLACAIQRGDIYPVTIGASTTKENMEAATTVIKGISNALQFMSTNYNPAGVHTYTDTADQILIMNSRFDASMDVNVLAAAFNMDKAQFMGNRVLVDGFGDLDLVRLNKLFAGNPDYTPLTEAELQSLNEIPAVLVDRSWFMIFDNLLEMDERHNGEGLYWNYWLHTWKTFSYSPFVNAVLFSKEDPTVTAVTVSPATTPYKAVGNEIAFSAQVTGNNFPSKDVTWSSSDSSVEIGTNGVAKIVSVPTAAVTITATSITDSTKSGTATITLS